MKTEHHYQFTDSKPIKDLTKDEQALFVRELLNDNITARFIGIFLLETGLRVSEALQITLGDLRRAIAMNKPFLKCVTLKQKQQWRRKVIRTKLSKYIPHKKVISYRTIPIRTNRVHHHFAMSLYDVCVDYLKIRERHGDSRKIFLHPHWNADSAEEFNLTRIGVWKFLKKIFTRMGIPQMSVHSLRHSFAMNRLREGCPLTVLQKLLGHKTLASLHVYLAPREEDLFTAMGVDEMKKENK